MRPLLAMSTAIDRLNEKIGYICNLLVLFACLVSAGNAMIRYAFGYSSNGWLEAQWYMFAILVMFGASYTFKRNEHVRVEIFYLILSERGQLWLDLIGTLLLPDPVLPAAVLSVLAVLHAGLRRRRDVGQCRRPGPLADQVRDSGRLRHAGAAGRLRGDQAHRGAAGLRRRSTRNTRGRPNDHAGNDAAADVRRPGSGDADRLPGGVHAGSGRAVVRLPRRSISASSTSISCRRFPAASSAACCPTSCCSRFPFFTFMGAILERCGLAEDMLDSMGQLFGPIRGGLGYSVIIVGFILGAITGTVAAQVIAMALISMPVMIRYGYNMRYITGVLAASGTITQLVPPSLVLIVLADQLGKSVGDMYLGAWGPSVFQIVLFAGYTFMLGIFKPDHVPAVPKDALTLTGWPLWKKMPDGHHPVGGADLRRARHHDAGPGDADGSRRHGRDRRHRARGDPPQGLQHAPASKMLIVGVIAAGIGTIIGIFLTREHCLQAHLRGRLSRRGLDLPRGRSNSRPAQPDQAGLRDHHAPHQHGGVHPDRLDLLLGGVPRRLRRRLAGASC